MAIYKNTPPTITDGLVLSLDAANRKSYTSGSAIWTDLSGNGYSGSLVGSPIFSSQNGGNIIFDGANNYATVSDSSLFNLDNGLTVSIWFKRDNTGITNARLLYKGAASNAIPGFLFSTSTTSLSAIVGDGTTRTTATTPISANTWEHVSFVYKKSEIFQVYRSGILIDSQTPYSINCNNTTNLTIASQVTTLLFPGSISNISWYNRVLTQTEILQNYNATKARFNIS